MGTPRAHALMAALKQITSGFTLFVCGLSLSLSLSLCSRVESPCSVLSATLDLQPHQYEYDRHESCNNMSVLISVFPRCDPDKSSFAVHRWESFKRRLQRYSQRLRAPTPCLVPPLKAGCRCLLSAVLHRCLLRPRDVHPEEHVQRRLPPRGLAAATGVRGGGRPTARDRWSPKGESFRVHRPPKGGSSSLRRVVSSSTNNSFHRCRGAAKVASDSSGLCVPKLAPPPKKQAHVRSPGAALPCPPMLEVKPMSWFLSTFALRRRLPSPALPACSDVLPA